MDKITLIDAICNDNDYILSFQATKEAQNLAKSLIAVRDGAVDNFDNVKKAINDLIIILNDQITKENDELSKDYLNDILAGVLKSQNRLL